MTPTRSVRDPRRHPNDDCDVAPAVICDRRCRGRRTLGDSRALRIVRSMTSIGVISSGNIGATVGEAWRRAGHEVVYASRSPDPPRTVAIADAIARADVALLAVAGAAAPELPAEHAGGWTGAS